MKFTEKDLDMDKFHIAFEKEIDDISSTSAKNHYATGKPRTRDEIGDTVYPSKICEEYLVQNEGFTYSDRKWHDVISSDGELVEVKFLNEYVNSSMYERYIKGIHNKIKEYNHSRYIYAFQYIQNEYQLVYILDTKGN